MRRSNKNKVMRQKTIMFIWTDENDFPTFMSIFNRLSTFCTYKVILFYKSQVNSNRPSNENILSRCFSYYGTYDVNEILKLEKPDLLILGNDTSIIARVFIYAAIDEKIPTLLVPHGFTSKAQRRFIEVIRDWKKFLSREDFKYNISVIAHSGYYYRFLSAAIYTLRYGYSMGYSGCSKICCVGTEHKNILANRGVPECSLVITGNPRFDNISYYKNNKLNTIYHKYNLSNDHRIITILEGALADDGIWTIKQLKEWLQCVLSEIKKYKNAFPIIKLHPRQNIDKYKYIIKEIIHYDVPVIKNEFELYEILSQTDLVIGVSSTALLEAMALNRLVMVISLFNDVDCMGYVRSNSVLYVDKKENINSALHSALYDSDLVENIFTKQSLFIEKNVSNIQSGTASIAVADVVNKLLNRTGAGE